MQPSTPQSTPSNRLVVGLDFCRSSVWTREVNMNPLLFLFIVGSIVAVIVGLLFYLHDRKARRWTMRPTIYRHFAGFSLLTIRYLLFAFCLFPPVPTLSQDSAREGAMRREKTSFSGGEVGTWTGRKSTRLNS